MCIQDTSSSQPSRLGIPDESRMHSNGGPSQEGKFDQLFDPAIDQQPFSACLIQTCPGLKFIVSGTDKALIRSSQLNKTVPYLIIAAGITLWIVSLFLPALYFSDFSAPAHFKPPLTGYQVLKYGTIFIAEGAGKGLVPFIGILFVPLIWGLFANPLMLMALLAALLRLNRLARFLGIGAVIAAQTAWVFFLFHAQASDDLAFPALCLTSTGFFAWDAGLVLILVGVLHVSAGETH